LSVREKGVKYTYFPGIILLQISSFFLEENYFSQLINSAVLLILPLTFLIAYFILNDAFYRLSEINKMG